MNQTVWEGLCLIAEHGCPQRSHGFHVNAESPPKNRQNDYYHAVPTVGVVASSSRPLNQEVDPVLQLRLRDYFNNCEKEIGCLLLMRSLADSPAVSFVTGIAEGSRRWWVGSFLRWAEKDPKVSHGNYRRLESILLGMLCGWNCDHEIEEHKAVDSKVDFPISPYNYYPDQAMNVVDESEAKFLAHFLRTSVPEDKAVFRDSPRERNPDHAGFEKCVRYVISELLKIDNLIYDRLALVSITG